MSALTNEIHDQLAKYLAGDTTLYEFSGWLAPVVWDIEERHDPEAEDLAYAVFHRMAEQSSGYISEDHLRRLLRPLLKPAPATAAS